MEMKPIEMTYDEWCATPQSAKHRDAETDQLYVFRIDEVTHIARYVPVTIVYEVA